MILVLLGTQNNSFHRLLEEIEKNIDAGNITDKVVVQAGFTKYKSNKMEIFDMIPQEELDKLIKEADLVITHGGVGSIMAAVKQGKKVIAVPRLKKYGEHVNDHQLEIIETFKKQGIIIGINDVTELAQALKDAEVFKVGMTDFDIDQKIAQENSQSEFVNQFTQTSQENKIVKIIDEFIQNDINKKKKKEKKKENTQYNGRR